MAKKKKKNKASSNQDKSSDKKEKAKKSKKASDSSSDDKKQEAKKSKKEEAKFQKEKKKEEATSKLKKKVAKLRSGFLVKVVHLSPDGKRDFTTQGVVLRVRGDSKRNKTFTVRSLVEGVGVEKVFNFASPALKDIEILKENPARRSRLYYLRDDESSSSKKGEA